MNMSKNTFKNILFCFFIMLWAIYAVVNWNKGNLALVVWSANLIMFIDLIICINYIKKKRKKDSSVSNND